MIRDNRTEIKRNIFEIYDTTRTLWNDFYNSKDGNYTNDEIKALFVCVITLLRLAEELKEEIKRHIEF